MKNYNNLNINKLVFFTFTIVLILTYISFVIIYEWFTKYPLTERDLLKETLTLTISCFSVFSTLAAAYIASRLFNKWQDQHNKQVNSDFIMKFYDDLFNMKADALSIVGFLKDFSGLSFEKKIEHYEDLKTNNIRLCRLNDFSMQKLSDLAFILNEDEYNNGFKIKIVELGEKLQSLLQIYKTFITTYSQAQRNNLNSLSNIQESERILLASLPDLQADLYNHYRAFMVELQKYYRA